MTRLAAAHQQPVVCCLLFRRSYPADEPGPQMAACMLGGAETSTTSGGKSKTRKPLITAATAALARYAGRVEAHHGATPETTGS